jgi:hypothetical protein
MAEEQDKVVNETVPPRLHRARRRRQPRRSAGAGLSYLPDGLAILLLVAAVALWLYDPRWQLLAGLVLVLGLLVAVVRLHYRVTHYVGWWLFSCPQCQADALRRLRRRRWQRLLGWAGIPVRPYICGACGWRGSRIDQTKL